MSGRKSRQKGANFERAVAGDLRHWLTGNRLHDDEADWTVARLRPDEQQGLDHAGEFAIVGPFRMQLAIECKAHKAFDARQLWKTPITGPFLGWWEQACEQARGCAKAPLLVINVERGENLAVMRYPTWATLFAKPLPSFRLLHAPRMRLSVLEGRELWMDLTVIRWSDLMAINPLALAELPGAL